MRVDSDQPACKLRMSLFAPHSPISQEEALLRGIAGDLLTSLFTAPVVAHHLAQSHQCDASATVVGGVLTQGQFAIQLKIVHCDEVAVLVGDTTGACFKF